MEYVMYFSMQKKSINQKSLSSSQDIKMRPLYKLIFNLDYNKHLILVKIRVQLLFV